LNMSGKKRLALLLLERNEGELDAFTREGRHFDTSVCKVGVKVELKVGKGDCKAVE